MKYLHKYIHKGGDRAETQLSADYDGGGLEQLDAHGGYGGPPMQPRNEITEYLEGRYISTSEAVWRFMCYPLHHNAQKSP